jgi:hypothetical protein
VDRAIQFLPKSPYHNPIAKDHVFAADRGSTASGTKDRGVIIEFDSRSMKSNQSKTQPDAEGFVAHRASPEALKCAVKIITIRGDAQMGDGERKILRQTLHRLVNDGWTRSEDQGGVKYERPDFERKAAQ